MGEVILGLMPVSSLVTRLVRGLFHVKHTGAGRLFALGGVGLVILVGVGAGDGVSLGCSPRLAAGRFWDVRLS